MLVVPDRPSLPQGRICKTAVAEMAYIVRVVIIGREGVWAHTTRADRHHFEFRVALATRTPTNPSLRRAGVDILGDGQ
jgi:hypothetical protein